MNAAKWLWQQVARSLLPVIWLIDLLWSRRWLVGTTLLCSLLLWLAVVLKPEPTSDGEFAVDDDVLIFDEIDQRQNGDENSTETTRPQPSAENVAATARGLNVSGPLLGEHDESGPFFLVGDAVSVPDSGSGNAPLSSLDASGQSIPEWPARTRAAWLTGTIEEVGNSTAAGRTTHNNTYLLPRK